MVLPQIHLPITLRNILIAMPIIFVPALLTAKQPDLSTASLLVIAGGSVLFLAGLSFRIIAGAFAAIAVLAPIAWYGLYDYQRKRIFTFLNPENDPLGAGYISFNPKLPLVQADYLVKAGCTAHNLTFTFTRAYH